MTDCRTISHFLRKYGKSITANLRLGTRCGWSPVELTPERISEFFFDILLGKIQFRLLVESLICFYREQFQSNRFGFNPVGHSAGSAVPKEQEPSRTPCMNGGKHNTTFDDQSSSDAVRIRAQRNPRRWTNCAAWLHRCTQEGQTETSNRRKCSVVLRRRGRGRFSVLRDCGISLA